MTARRDAPTPPGVFKAQRARHLADQRLYDAIKRLRAEPEVWVTWRGERMRLIPPSADSAMHYRAPVVAHFGCYGLQIGQEHERGDESFIRYQGQGRPCDRPWTKALAIVEERHPVAPAPPPG